MPISVKTPPILEAKAKGIIKREGFTPAVLAMARTIGRSMATVPVLLTKAATTAVTDITTKKRFFSLVPAKRRKRPAIYFANPVWKIAPPTTKRKTIMMTAVLAKPLSAALGVTIPHSMSAAIQPRATMSDLILPIKKKMIVTKKMRMVKAWWSVCVSLHSCIQREAMASIVGVFFYVIPI